MDFSDKLNFLFELTQAAGKDLATAMNITPPQISKMRNGLRGLPRDRESSYSIALFFAQRCQSNEQRDSLATAMHMAQVRSVDDDAVLADMLHAWFLNEKNHDNNAEKSVESFLHRLTFSGGTRNSTQADSLHPLQSNGNNITAYYGIEGKQAAYLAFLRHLLEKNGAFDICVLSDENNTWIDDDPAFASTYFDYLLRLTEQGCFFKRIVGSLNSIAQAFYSLNRWYPLYLTGKAASYYYKRMRDDLNKVTVFAVQDVVAMFSLSVGSIQEKNCVTIYTTDKTTVNAMLALFNKYLSMCDPAMKTFNADTSEAEMYERLLAYESYESTCMQHSDSLSFITLPWEIAVSLHAGGETKQKDAFLGSLAKRHKVFLNNLKQYHFFDFVCLATVDEIVAGMVPIPAANILSSEVQYYSPSGYLQHLNSVVYLLKHRSHYHVILESPNAEEEPIVYVKEDEAVLITRASTPFIIFDVSEHNLIRAFTENMRRRIPNDIFDPDFRNATLASIQMLINQIENAINK